MGKLLDTIPDDNPTFTTKEINGNPITMELRSINNIYGCVGNRTLVSFPGGYSYLLDITVEEFFDQVKAKYSKTDLEKENDNLRAQLDELTKIIEALVGPNWKEICIGK